MKQKTLALTYFSLWLVLPLVGAFVHHGLEFSAIEPEFQLLLVVLHCIWCLLILHPDQHLDNFWDGYIKDIEKLAEAPQISLQKSVDMKSLPLIICGCCRDVEAYLSNVLESMHSIGAQFRDYQIVIFENDSCDGTRRILQDQRERFPGMLTLLLEDGMKFPLRTARLAYIRNRLLATALPLDPANEGLLLMMDMDDVAAEGTLAQTLHTCFSYPFESWEALCTNRHSDYYDIYALRIHRHIEFNFATRCARFPTMDGKRKYFLRFRQRIGTSDRLLPVLSAFGGATLYKISALSGKSYIGLESDGFEICEHLSLHAQLIAEGGRIFINTRMVMA
jgi:hypothetical protein